MATQRNTATKRLIKQAFIDILREKGIDGLTMSGIARRAGINRGTVYLHYTDKFDMLRKLEDEAIADLTAILFPEHGQRAIRKPEELVPYSAILAALDYVRDDFAFFQVLIGTNGDPMFAERMKDLLADLIAEEVERSEGVSLDMQGMPIDYAREMALGGLMAILLLWVKKGGVEPTEQIAGMISRAKHLSPYDMLT